MLFKSDILIRAPKKWVWNFLIDPNPWMQYVTRAETINIVKHNKNT
jgi:hypothetical protein